MTHGSGSHEPVSGEGYSWQETPAGTQVREYLQDAFQFGDIRTFGSAIMPLYDGTNLRDAIDRVAPELGINIDNDATHIEMPTYEKHDHATTLYRYPYAGLAVSLVGRYTFGENTPIEPYRVGISLGGGAAGDLLVDITIPSRAAEIGAVMPGPLTDEEKRPPHATVRTAYPSGDPKSRVHSNGIITAAKWAVKKAPVGRNDGTGPRDEEDQQRMLDSLDALRTIVQQVGTTSEQGVYERELNDEALTALLKFCEIHFPV